MQRTAQRLWTPVKVTAVWVVLVAGNGLAAVVSRVDDPFWLFYTLTTLVSAVVLGLWSMPAVPPPAVKVPIAAGPVTVEDRPTVLDALALHALLEASRYVDLQDLEPLSAERADQLVAAIHADRDD